MHVEYIGQSGPAGASAEATAADVGDAQIIGAPADRSAVKACLERYRRCSASIFDVLKRHCTACEKGSLDEAFLDVTEQVEALVKDSSMGQLDWEGHVYTGQRDGDATSQEQPMAESLSDLYLWHAAQLAAKARLAVYEECGITCSAGIAHNKLLAKLGSVTGLKN